MAGTKKVWTADASGNIDAGARAEAPAPKGFWKRVKWGQVLAFGFGGFCLFAAVANGYDSSGDRVKLQVGGILMAVGLALRAIDAIQALARSLALRGDRPNQPL